MELQACGTRRCSQRSPSKTLLRPHAILRRSDFNSIPAWQSCSFWARQLRRRTHLSMIFASSSAGSERLPSDDVQDAAIREFLERNQTEPSPLLLRSANDFANCRVHVKPHFNTACCPGELVIAVSAKPTSKQLAWENDCLFYPGKLFLSAVWRPGIGERENLYESTPFQAGGTDCHGSPPHPSFVRAVYRGRQS